MLLFIYCISFFNKTIFLQTTSKWTSYEITNISEFFTSHITSFINSTTLTESASILEKANHFLPKSFNEAPIWYTSFWSIMINRSCAFVKMTPLKLGYCLLAFSMSMEESSSSYTNICENIKVGTAVIERIVKVKGNQHFGLNKSPNEQFLYGLRMTEGMEIYLFFNASVSQRIKVSLKVEYEVDYSDIDVESLKSITDMRGNSNHSELRIQLRDKSTGLPIKGKLLIDNSKRINGLYSGSDFIFSIQEREHLKLSIDVIGYFFQDQEVFVEAEKNKEIILWLEPAELGKKMEIQGIQFKTGSSELLKGAEVKLVRLKDFLLLNSSIHIED